MNLLFEVDPDVRRARTLDKAFYLDEGVWQRSSERIFARSWQWLGDVHDVAEAGSLSPRLLLPGLLDEPLLLARDEGGALRCLSNVCTHRGNLLVHEACRAAQIRCGYHSRRFDLAGRMLFMPGFEAACDFPASSDHLPTLPLGQLGPHAFVSLDPLAPLADFIGDAAACCGGIELNDCVHDPTRDREFEFSAHWALYVENYLEGLHIPFIHPGLTQTLDLAGYGYELRRWSNLQLALARDGEAAFALPPDSLDSPAHGQARGQSRGQPHGQPHGQQRGQRIAAYYWWVFPNLMLNFYPWGLSLNLVMPLARDRTRVLFRSYVRDPTQLGQGAGGALDTVELEDEAVVQTVQRGIRSRLYSRGRYAPQAEAGVHHFHRLLCEVLAE